MGQDVGVGPILLTGARGTIGSVLAAGLDRRELLRKVDLPEVDLRDAAAARAAVAGCRQVIHLAWDTRAENHLSGTFCAGNLELTFNVLSASLAAGVERLVFASSVHAQAYSPGAPAVVEIPGGVLGAERERAPIPDSPYGAAKLFGEALCRWAAGQGMETVAIRFGGVNPADAPPQDDELERSVWLSHRDCRSAVELALAAPLPDGYAQFTAVSANAERPHAFENELGWMPRDGAPRA
jgi:nucleoside-diphosphate-sugar epimerase